MTVVIHWVFLSAKVTDSELGLNNSFMVWHKFVITFLISSTFIRSKFDCNISNTTDTPISFRCSYVYC